MKMMWCKAAARLSLACRQTASPSVSSLCAIPQVNRRRDVNSFRRLYSSSSSSDTSSYSSLDGELEAIFSSRSLEPPPASPLPSSRSALESSWLSAESNLLPTHGNNVNGAPSSTFGGGERPASTTVTPNDFFEDPMPESDAPATISSKGITPNPLYSPSEFRVLCNVVLPSVLSLLRSSPPPPDAPRLLSLSLDLLSSLASSPEEYVAGVRALHSSSDAPPSRPASNLRRQQTPSSFWPSLHPPAPPPLPISAKFFSPASSSSSSSSSSYPGAPHPAGEGAESEGLRERSRPTLPPRMLFGVFEEALELEKWDEAKRVLELMEGNKRITDKMRGKLKDEMKWRMEGARDSSTNADT